MVIDDASNCETPLLISAKEKERERHMIMRYRRRGNILLIWLRVGGSRGRIKGVCKKGKARGGAGE